MYPLGSVSGRQDKERRAARAGDQGEEPGETPSTPEGRGGGSEGWRCPEKFWRPHLAAVPAPETTLFFLQPESTLVLLLDPLHHYPLK